MMSAINLSKMDKNLPIKEALADGSSKDALNFIAVVIRCATLKSIRVFGWTFSGSRPAHWSNPFGLDWTQSFDPIFGLGLYELFLNWAGCTAFSFLPAMMDWSRLDNFSDGSGLFGRQTWSEK